MASNTFALRLGEKAKPIKTLLKLCFSNKISLKRNITNILEKERY